MITDEVAERPSRHVFAPEGFPILGPLWAHIGGHLADGRWHPFADVVASAVANGFHPKTTKELLRRARQAGRIAQAGGYSAKRVPADTRTIRLVSS